MIKKIALASVATLVLIALPAQASGHGEKKDGNTQMMHKKGKKKASPFLIQSGLPHFTKLLKKNWDNEKLALTPEQKTKLLEVRKATLGGVMKYKPQIMALEKEIRKAIKSGTKSEALKTKVDMLAKLRAEATMVHLRCIENTKTILDKTQLQTLKDMRKKH